MKPSKKLSEMAHQYALLEKEERNLINTIQVKQHEYFTNLIGKSELTSENIQKFNGIRLINAQNLTLITQLDDSICKHLDNLLETNADFYLSDYEEFSSEQWCGLAGCLPFKENRNDESGIICKDLNLIYDRSIFDSEQEYTEHLAWKEEQKAQKLKTHISLIDSVVLELQIWYQTFFDYRKGKWVKGLYPPKYQKAFRKK